MKGWHSGETSHDRAMQASLDQWNADCHDRKWACSLASGLSSDAMRRHHGWACSAAKFFGDYLFNCHPIERPCVGAVQFLNGSQANCQVSLFKQVCSLESCFDLTTVVSPFQTRISGASGSSVTWQVTGVVVTGSLETGGRAWFLMHLHSMWKPGYSGPGFDRAFRN